MRLLWLRWGFVPVAGALSVAMEAVGDPPIWLFMLVGIGLGLAWPTTGWRVSR